MGRLRPVTLAMLWYPVVCLLAAGALGGWLWLSCGDEPDPPGCRAEVGPGMLLFLGAILVSGLAVLAVMWAVTKLFSMIDRGEAPGTTAGFSEDSPPSQDGPASPEDAAPEEPPDRG